jgi:hypothetical protein
MICARQDFEKVEKLGQGFSSTDPLEEKDIGDGITPRLTFVNKNMCLGHKDAIIKLLKDYVDCLDWNYREMPKLSQELVEHQLPIKSSFRPYKQPAQGLIRLFTIGLSRRRNNYSTHNSFDLANTWSGFVASYPWRTRIRQNLGMYRFS